MTFTIRPAVITDINGIARVHVESWQTTYAHILASDYLHGLSIEERADMWRGIFSSFATRSHHIVAESSAGEIVGFASYGPERDGNIVYYSELYVIYLLADFQRQGIGRALVRHAMRDLVADKYHNMMVWVLEQNPAVEFYKTMGGVLVEERKITIDNMPLKEYAYGFDDLPSLIKKQDG